MKRFLLVCVFTAVAAVSAKASIDIVAPSDSIDLIGGGSGTGGGRSLFTNDLQVFVLDFTITNHSTGEYLDGELNAQPGSYPIPISGTSGLWTAVFYLSKERLIRTFTIQ